MAEAVVAEECTAARIVGAVAAHAVRDRVAIDRARTNDRRRIVWAGSIVRAGTRVVRTGAIIRAVAAVVGVGEHAADDGARDNAGADGRSPTAELDGFHV